MAEFVHFRWIVRARGRNQRSLLRLYELSQKCSEVLTRDSVAQSVFTLLVGAAFSLWRAASLSDVTRTGSAIVGDAKKLLARLVQDNAVAYPQDRDTREWMSGYYLNNAKWRLEEVCRRLSKTPVDREAAQLLSRIAKVNIIQERSTENWKQCDLVLANLVRLLGVAFAQQMPKPRQRVGRKLDTEKRRRG